MNLNEPSKIPVLTCTKEDTHFDHFLFDKWQAYRHSFIYTFSSLAGVAKKVDTQEAKLDNVTNEVAETNKTVKQIDEKVSQQETELNDLSDQVQEQKTDLKELRAEFAEAMIDIERIDRKVG